MTVASVYGLAALALLGAFGCVGARRPTLAAAAWGLCLAALGALAVLLDAAFVALFWVAASAAAVVVVVLFNVSFIEGRAASTPERIAPAGDGGVSRSRGGTARIVGTIVIGVAVIGAAVLLDAQDLSEASFGDGFGGVHAVGLALAGDGGVLLALAGLMVLVVMLGIGRLADREAE